MLTAPYESPPPYSEFDPAKHDSNPGPARPTSLEIDVETGRDEPEEEDDGISGATDVVVGKIPI